MLMMSMGLHAVQRLQPQREVHAVSLITEHRTERRWKCGAQQGVVMKVSTISHGLLTNSFIMSDLPCCGLPACSLLWPVSVCPALAPHGHSVTSLPIRGVPRDDSSGASRPSAQPHKNNTAETRPYLWPTLQPTYTSKVNINDT